MDMESMAKLMQALMSNSNNSDSSEQNSENSENYESSENSEKSDTSENADNMDFSGMFDNIDFVLLSKMGEIFSLMNKPDRNSELLLALKPHLRAENRHKVDSAVKLSRMMSMLPYLKESGILDFL